MGRIVPQNPPTIDEFIENNLPDPIHDVKERNLGCLVWHTTVCRYASGSVPSVPHGAGQGSPLLPANHGFQLWRVQEARRFVPPTQRASLRFHSKTSHLCGIDLREHHENGPGWGMDWLGPYDCAIHVDPHGAARSRRGHPCAGIAPAGLSVKSPYWSEPMPMSIRA